MSNQSNKVNRRDLLKVTMLAGATQILGFPYLALGKKGKKKNRDDENGETQGTGTISNNGRLFGYVPFTQPLYIPPVLTDVGVGGLFPTPEAIFNRPNFRGDTQAGGAIAPTGDGDDVAHGIAPEFSLASGACSDWNQTGVGTTHAKEFKLFTEETLHKFFGPDGPETPIFSYRDGTMPPGSGTTPGPTVLVDYLGPAVLRNCNLLTRDRSPVNSTDHDHETSIHLHGAHAPAHSDGYPDFYVLGGEARDFFYPNIAPRVTDPATLIAPVCDGEFDTTWIPSTLWYHDHGMDVTGFNVARGLAGFYLVVDQRERDLADQGVIPAIGGPQDIGLALQDQRFNADGTIFYDFLDHNGRLGDVFTVNGRVQPKHKVERQKYRFRFLNASNARIYQIRLSNRQKMCIIGTDSWLLPKAVEVESFQLNPGQRHDVIIDFRDVLDGVTEVFVENIMHQTDGRKAKGVDPDKQRDRLLKFQVSTEDNHPSERKCMDRDVIRGFKGVDDPVLGEGHFSFIRDNEVVKTRFFAFKRSHGAWIVNNRFFNPRRSDANPVLGKGAERWFFENSSGGWWHPIHAHLEGFQIKTINGELPKRERQFNSDLVQLEGGDKAEVLIKFRTFTGPFVFHCHTIEHEDMRMMGTYDPTPDPVNGDPNAIDATPPLDGETRIDPAVSGVVPDCTELEEEGRIFFDVAGDVDRLEGRGVGFPECEFDNE